MNINFERLRLQMHFRQLYDRLGAMDAEIVIVDAFLREQARHDTMQAQQAQSRGSDVVGIPNV
jgi:hypothetical protein